MDSTDASTRQAARDVELLTRLAQGDSQRALIELYDSLAPSVMAVLLHIWPTRAEAEAALQDVFVEIWRRAGQYQPTDQSVRAWTIALTRACTVESQRADPQTRAEDSDIDAAATLEALEPSIPPAHAFKTIQAAIDRVIDSDADSASTPAPRPSQLHPHTRRVVSLAQRRATRAIAFATFALAAAAAFGFLWYRERDKVSEVRHDVTIASTRASFARANLLEELDLERAQHKALSSTLADLQARDHALQSPGIQLATLRAKDGGSATIFHDADTRRWVVFGFGLPAVADRNYQLWLLPADDGAAVDAGVLERTAEGTLTITVEVPAELEAVKAAISLEPAGGSKTPTQAQIKLIGSLQ